jgi:hypothetical protein
MVTPNIAVYDAGALAPGVIDQNLDAAKQAGWTTIILGLLHIGRPDVPGQQYGDIVYGADPIVIQAGQWKLGDRSWPDAVASLKQGSSIDRIYASFGGGGVEDYKSLKKIYDANGGSFAGTAVETNFKLFRDYFPAVDGIDFDCEETYHSASFVAFCEMLAGMGFGLTFCPYDHMSFWTDALKSLAKSTPGAVKWWNLQCYDGGGANHPADWAAAIARAIPGYPTDGFILAGDWTQDGGPDGVEKRIAGFAAKGSLGGGFMWDMNAILGSSSSMADYVDAIRKGLGSARRPDARLIANRSGGGRPQKKLS